MTAVEFEPCIVYMRTPNELRYRLPQYMKICNLLGSSSDREWLKIYNLGYGTRRTKI